jgi:rhomboid family GlyGly-CTERM serine protease
MTASAKRLAGVAVPLMFVTATLMIAVGGSAVEETLRYERDAVLGGELWRLLTGHLVHLGGAHLLVNVAGLALVWVFFGTALSPGCWVATSVVSALGVSLGLLALNQSIAWYVGLSGVLHGLFAAGLVARKEMSPEIRLLLTVLFAGKLAWEQALGPLPGTASAAGGNVIVDAHLYGTVAGFMTAFLLVFLRKTCRNY